MVRLFSFILLFSSVPAFLPADEPAPTAPLTLEQYLHQSADKGLDFQLPFLYLERIEMRKSLGWSSYYGGLSTRYEHSAYESWRDYGYPYHELWNRDGLSEYLYWGQTLPWGLSSNINIGTGWSRNEDAYAYSGPSFSYGGGVQLSLDLWQNLFGRVAQAYQGRDRLGLAAQSAQAQDDRSRAFYTGRQAYAALSWMQSAAKAAEERSQGLERLAGEALAPSDARLVQAAKARAELELAGLRASRREACKNLLRRAGTAWEGAEPQLQPLSELLSGSPETLGSAPVRLTLDAERLGVQRTEQELALRGQWRLPRLALIGSLGADVTDPYETHYKDGSPPYSYEKSASSRYGVAAELNIGFDQLFGRAAASVREAELDLKEQRLRLELHERDHAEEWRTMTLRYAELGDELSKAQALAELEQGKVTGGTGTVYERLSFLDDVYGARIRLLNLARDRFDLSARAAYYRGETTP